MAKFIYTSKIHLKQWINYLFNGTEKAGIKKLKNSKVFIDYSEAIDDNLKKKRKVLIVFDNMIADMEANEKLSLLVTKLFLRERKLNISIFLYHIILF